MLITVNIRKWYSVQNDLQDPVDDIIEDEIKEGDFIVFGTGSEHKVTCVCGNILTWW